MKIIWMMLLAVPLFGQTIPLVDESASGSPLTFDGTMTFDPTNGGPIGCSITALNHASRPIVAYRAHFDIVKPDGLWDGFVLPIDYFFEDLSSMVVPQPSVPYPFPLDCGRLFERVQATSSAKPPEARVKVPFVQLDDGMVWGDDDTIKRVMFQRKDALEYLQSLKAAYSSGGNAALAKLLQAHVDYTADHKLRQMADSERHRLMKLGDTETVAAKIDKELANAHAHAAWLK